LAGAVGFLLALGLIFLLEYLDDTLKSADDIGQSLGVITLGTISQIKGKYYSDKLITTLGPFSPTSEAYRVIRSNIQFMSVDQPIKSIMVTSSTAGEGKSVTVANLGIIMAQAGLKTIIVDSDLRRPTQHEIFQIPNHGGGLTELLCSPEIEIKNQLRDTKVENLRVLTSGVLPPNPAELLGSQRMGQLLAKLNDLADIVIFDSPPVLAVSDAPVFSNRVDGVILVILAGRARCEMIKQTLLNLRQANANVLGGVLNRVPKKRGYYGGYYYTPKMLPTSTGQSTNFASKRRWQWLPFLK
jgi:non-specific protein-tyrosine kinase